MAKEFLGVGWKFPVQLNANGEFKLSEHEEDIKEAIMIILKTTPGERVMQPKFGCGIYEYIFSTINITNLMLMEEEVKKALMLYEPRIEVEEVHATPNNLSIDAQILISIDYTIISTNDRQNLVYPFYLQEGG